MASGNKKICKSRKKRYFGSEIARSYRSKTYFLAKINEKIAAILKIGHNIVCFRHEDESSCNGQVVQGARINLIDSEVSGSNPPGDNLFLQSLYQ